MREFEGILRLQGIGIVEGIKAINLEVGDERVFNFGSTEKIIRIESNKTGKSVIVTCEYINEHARLEDGKWISEMQEDTRTIRNDTIIAVKELNPVEVVQEIVEVEPSVLEELKKESSKVILSINTESLETQKESFEVVSTFIDKIYKTIEEYNFENEQNEIELKGIANHLKYYYSLLDEMIEKQICPNANDFNNIETLKTVYITNWNELPQEIQEYVLSCDKYWINLQEVLIYKDNKIVVTIGISGHHKHDIEINSIGAGELFQWNLYKGYTLNNLEVSADKQENKNKVTHNKYDEMLDNYEILPFKINTDNEELKKVINIYADNETIEATRTIYRGSIDKGILYELYQNKGYRDLYIEYYQMNIYNNELKTILTYCEGDFIAEVYNSEADYNAGIERTKKFIDEM